jgi:hypothetical protein
MHVPDAFGCKERLWVMVTQVGLLSKILALLETKYEFFPGGKGEIPCRLSSLSRPRLELLERVSQAAPHRSI